MDKEYLTGLGLTEEEAEAILGLHQDELDKLGKGEGTDEVNRLKKQLEEKDKEIALLSEGNDGGELEESLEGVKEQLEEEYQLKIKEMEYGYELDKQLLTVNAKNVKAVKALLDLEKIKLEDGKLKGFAEQVKKLKGTDGYLFGDVEGKEGVLFSLGEHEKSDKPLQKGNGLFGI